MPKTVLTVDDSPSIRRMIAMTLEEAGYAVVEAVDGQDGLTKALSQPVDAIITDQNMPNLDGLGMIRALRAHPMGRGVPIIVLSAQNTLDTAVRASESEAFEYFPKPFDLDELVHAVRQAAGARASLDDESGASLPGGEGEKMPLVGRSQAMQGVYRMITRVLRNDLTVLVLGESGTGKELVAEAIHQLGQRRAGPFVAVNTAAIPGELIESELFGHEKGAFTGAVARHTGKFEQANGGTLFLDEIGDMPMQAQTRLLRALQSGTVRPVGGRDEIRVDVRIIAATNRDLQPMIAAGTFREDLYYRLNVVPITLPPLRERADDIPDLASHFLALAAREGLPRRQLSEDAAMLLSRQPWRGNVRELRNFIYRLALLSREDVIEAAALQPMLAEAPTGEVAGADGADLGLAVQAWLGANSPPTGLVYDAALAAFERPLFEAVLRETHGNQLRAAQVLGINRNTLRKRLGELGISAAELAR